MTKTNPASTIISVAVMPTPADLRQKFLESYKNLTLSQRIALFTFLFTLLLFPVLIIGSSFQTRTRSRASFPETPPETPPELTATPTPTAVTTTNLAAQILSNNTAIYAPPILPDNIFTFEAWLKIRPFTNTNNLDSRFLFAQGIPGSNIEVSLRISGNSTIYSGQAGRIHATVYDSTGQPVYLFFPGPIVSVDAWHHIAMTRDGALIKIFVDGILLGSQAYNGPTSFTNSRGLSLGAYSTSDPLAASFFASSFLNGEIDEIRLSDNIRYTDNFTPPFPPFQSDEATLALYHLDGDGQDSSIYQNQAELKGNIDFVDSTVPIPIPTETPVPSETPTPTVTPALIPNYPPQIDTARLPAGRIGKNYHTYVIGSDRDRNDQLNMRLINLPQGLSKSECQRYKYNEEKERKLIRCEIKGTPKKKGNYNVIIALTDGSNVSTKTLLLKITE